MSRRGELRRMERAAKSIGELVGGAVELECGTRKVGFVLALFEFGDGGWMTYVSNAQRDDIIEFLDELKTKLTKENH